jgi:hypothetical protein
VHDHSPQACGRDRDEGRLISINCRTRADECRARPKAGLYTISLSAGAWIGVVQDGHALWPRFFSGATDCDGIRKAMKYQLSASPFVLEISGAKENSISVAILPAE